MKTKKWILALLIAFVASLLFTLLHRDGLKDPTWNARVKTFAKPVASSERVQLVLLDQASLDWAETNLEWSWPWPREAYGFMTEFLSAGEPASIFFDVLYTEASVYDVDDDLIFGDAVGAAGNVVGAVDVESEVAHQIIPTLKSNMAVLAAVNLGISEELTVQDVALEFGATPAPATAMATLADALPADIPLTDRERMILKYRGGPGVYEPISAAALIQSALQLVEGEVPDIDPASFTDKHVLFGFSAPGLMDLRYTPFGKNVPGVHVHATAIDNLLAGDFIRQVRWPVVLLGTLLLCLLLALVILFSRTAESTLMALLAVLAVPVAAGWAAYALDWRWPVLAPLLAGISTWAVALMIRYATEGRQRAFITSAFKHYLSEDVIDQILDDPSRLQLGGERRELSIFFSDLQGFSRISERLEPQQLTALLNEYLTEMTNIILASGGTLDKYEGDAILAFWNAPIDQADHARRAVQAAIDCQERLAEKRAEWAATYKGDLYMRIGIHTGDVVVGNMGSQDRFDYTVLGDAANLAARLEGANKAFGTYMMVSEETRRQSGLSAREIGTLRVVGREEPVRVFEPLWSGCLVTPEDAERFAAGMTALRSGNVETARKQWRELEQDPVVAKSLAKVAEQPDWDGIWELDSK